MSHPVAIETITPEILLQACSVGLFPMSEGADDPGLFWLDPDPRGIFPLDGLIVSRRLARTLRSGRFEIRIDHDFAGILSACAEPAKGRENTWINERIVSLYTALFERGHAHCIGVYQGGALVGGLYGLALGAAFFGESMFHRVPDASKVALVHLVARLRAGQFQLLDTQFVTPHLASLGAVEIPRRTYRQRLAKAVASAASFNAWPDECHSNAEQVLKMIA